MLRCPPLWHCSCPSSVPGCSGHSAQTALFPVFSALSSAWSLPAPGPAAWLSDDLGLRAGKVREGTNIQAGGGLLGTKPLPPSHRAVPRAQTSLKEHQERGLHARCVSSSEKPCRADSGGSDSEGQRLLTHIWLRATTYLLQVLRKRIPRGEGVPGLPVAAPQQEAAAEQHQDSGAHGGHQDAAGHDPGRGGFCRGEGLGHVRVMPGLGDGDLNVLFTTMT